MSATVIAKKPEGTTFLSSRFELRLVREPQRKIRDQRSGEITGVTDPDRIEFRNGTYTARSKDEVEWLRQHRLYGDGDDGFRLMPEVAPDPSGEELDAIVAAGADAEALAGLLEAERANWDRPVVVGLIEGALERLAAAQKTAGK